ncbi:MAG: undecaprenyl/decaprenyl-phosphate alpha-N-acetylglucosaminyl 1-phosphate transferase, partial [Treponema sp.]|nr:undecaprenyl/decaprenyl-phosphate alpha-N-acetylglucosaminyl 1-phosphate transferase [Treponema sp.]
MDNLAHIIIVFVVSVVLSAGAVALVLWLSHKKEWYDHVNERKIHEGEVPRLGGIGFASTFIIVTAGVSLMYGKFDMMAHFLPCLLAMLIVLVSGAYDDFRPLAPRHKFALQLAAALCLVVSGFIFKRVIYIGAGFLSNLKWLGYPLTFLWVIGITNAINLIDGVDGLAGGLSAIIAFFFGLIFYFSVETSKAVLLCVCLVGVLIGFLI